MAGWRRKDPSADLSPRWTTGKFGKCGTCKTPLAGKRMYYKHKYKFSYCEECGKIEEAKDLAAKAAT